MVITPQEFMDSRRKELSDCLNEHLSKGGWDIKGQYGIIEQGSRVGISGPHAWAPSQETLPNGITGGSVSYRFARKDYDHQGREFGYILLKLSVDFPIELLDGIDQAEAFINARFGRGVVKLIDERSDKSTIVFMTFDLRTETVSEVLTDNKGYDSLNPYKGKPLKEGVQEFVKCFSNSEF